MNLSTKWLREFVALDPISMRDFAEAVTISGSKTEEYHTEGTDIDKVVVGRVLSITPHPDSDHLLIYSVDAGEIEPVQIVTGAQNLKENDLVPAALHGSTLPNGVKIKKGKLRGVEGFGMLCSLNELDLTLNGFPYAIENDAFMLQEDCKPGDPIQQTIDLDDTQVESEITSNHPDYFSVIGLAREVAAIFQKPLTLHTPVVKGGHDSGKELLDVAIEASDLCSACCARIIKNVWVKPSPRWMRERLRMMGAHLTNNIVDITNYVMLEYGQPMHAFDLRFVEQGNIRVRRAKAGEGITTLDGVERKLNESNLVIVDAARPAAMAGVMDGEYSGIMGDTMTIVFESACFDAISVRLTVKALGMCIDASSRFEKGLDPNNCLPALERACELIGLLDAGDVLDDVMMDGTIEVQPHRIPLEADWVNRFLGCELPAAQMEEILGRIGCRLDSDTVIVLTFRPDLQHKTDIAEEIARFHGYNNIPGQSLPGGAQGKFSARQRFDSTVSSATLALGLSEIIAYSFISPKYYNKIRMPVDSPLRRSVVISNPLGEDMSMIRTVVLLSVMEVLAKNYNNRNAAAALFGPAREYLPTEPDKLPVEHKVLIAGLYGNDTDFFTLEGIVEDLPECAGVTGWDTTAALDEFSYHPGRCAALTIESERLGILSEIHPQVQENYDIGERVYNFTLDLDLMFRCAQTEKHYTPLPKFPAVIHNLALIYSGEIPMRDLQKAIVRGTDKLLESVCLSDVYKGEQIEAGKKSVAFSLALRSGGGMLSEEATNSVMEKVFQELEKIGALLCS